MWIRWPRLSRRMLPLCLSLTCDIINSHQIIIDHTIPWQDLFLSTQKDHYRRGVKSTQKVQKRPGSFHYQPVLNMRRGSIQPRSWWSSFERRGIPLSWAARTLGQSRRGETFDCASWSDGVRPCWGWARSARCHCSAPGSYTAGRREVDFPPPKQFWVWPRAGRPKAPVEGRPRTWRCKPSAANWGCDRRGTTRVYESPSPPRALSTPTLTGHQDHAWTSGNPWAPENKNQT